MAWNKTYQVATSGQSVISTSDGYVLAGYYIIMHEGMGIALIKTDFDGNEIWNRTYEGFNMVSSMIAVDDGYIVTGFRLDPAVPKGINAYLARIDRNGNMTW